MFDKELKTSSGATEETVNKIKNCCSGASWDIF